MRYQGNAVVVAEVEARWDFHHRISAIGFAGVGKAADNSSELSDAQSESTYVIGIRYLAAKKMAMRIGLDVAKGPEDTVWYLTMGQAWDQQEAFMSESRLNRLSVFSVFLALVGSMQAVSAEEIEHRHHVAAAIGGAAHDSKTSTFIGVDYVYRFSDSWVAGVFLEEVSGNFDIRT